jgi:DNA polymerase-3 subunit delta
MPTPRAYLLWGQEELRKREALAGLLDTLVPPEDRALDVEYVDVTNPGVTGESILHAARDRAMFSERRVVVVMNAGRLRGPRHQRTQDVLAAGLAGLPEHSTLILVAYAEEAEERRGRAPFGEKLMAAFKAHGKVLQFALLKPEELAQLARREAEAAGKQIQPAAATALAVRAGPDSQRVLQEVRKLVCYIGDREAITEQDVALHVPAPPDDNVFHLLDAALAGNQQQALAVMADLRRGGMAPQQLISQLTGTLRKLAQAKYAAEARVPAKSDPDQVPAAVRAVLPRESLFVTTKPNYGRTKLWEQAPRFSWPALHRAFDRLAVLDAGAKGWEHGSEDPDLGLELFVADLCGAVRLRR